jgi:hypothetical protein
MIALATGICNKHFARQRSKKSRLPARILYPGKIAVWKKHHSELRAA